MKIYILTIKFIKQYNFGIGRLSIRDSLKKLNIKIRKFDTNI